MALPKAVESNRTIMTMLLEAENWEIVHNEPDQALVIKLVSQSGTACAVKVWESQRVVNCWQQIAAELSSQQLSGLPGSELVGIPLHMSGSVTTGWTMVYPWGHQSMESFMRTKQYLAMGMHERQEMAKHVMAGVAHALDFLHTVPASHGGPRIHRDVKKGNILFNPSTGMVLLTDCGLLVHADLSDFFPGWSLDVMCPELAKPPDNEGCSRAMLEKEAMRSATTPAMDMYMLAHTIVEFLFGELPAAVDYDCCQEAVGADYDAGMLSYCKSVYCFDWEVWLQQQSKRHPELDASFCRALSRCLSNDPESRFSPRELLELWCMREHGKQAAAVILHMTPILKQERDAVLRWVGGGGMGCEVQVPNLRKLRCPKHEPCKPAQPHHQQLECVMDVSTPTYSWSNRAPSSRRRSSYVAAAKEQPSLVPDQ